MKKVLMVGNSPSVKGGITTVINQFRNYNWKKEDIDFKFIPTYIDRNNFLKVIYFIVSIFRIIISFLSYKPDVVHIHMSYKGSFERKKIICKMCIFFNVQYIIHLHGSEFKKWYDTLNSKKRNNVKSLLKNAEYVIVLGQEWKKRINEIEKDAKIIVVNNTVKIVEDTAIFKRENKEVLFLGVLIKRKGVHDLLKAVSILKLKEKISNVKIKIAGDGEEKENLIEMAKKLEISQYVEFIGWIDENEKRCLLKNAQLLILPSYNEGLPMSILEGMNYGLPIIATNVGDVPEAVINGKNGFIVEPGNFNKLAYYIEKIILSDENYWDMLSKNSKQIVKEKFSDENYFNIFKKIYEGEV